MKRTRIKICGLTRVEDALAAVELGADALGFVFYAPSPRNVELERAAQIAARVPAFVTLVGLFVEPEPTWVQQVLQAIPLDLLQFHGDETDVFCNGFGKRYLKAIRVHAGMDVAETMALYPHASGILLDTYVQGVAGGTGERFDWGQIPDAAKHSVILAGGLSVANVADAVTQVRPYAVDVSGGVEAAKGIKDFEKMSKFISEVRRGDSF